MATDQSCNNELQNTPTSFIGYSSMAKDGSATVRIYLNCKDSTRFESSLEAIFEKGKDVRLEGLNDLAAVRKFNRLIGALEERAREEKIPRERVFASAQDLIYFLSRIKHSQNFSKWEQ